MKPIRWGVLGVANIAVRTVIPAIQSARGAELVAIASRTPDRAGEAAERLGVRAHGSYEALLADPEIDAVYIPLPNALHREWTVRSAAAGKHVLCEKPLALTALEAREMIAACRAHGVQLMEAFMYRFHPRTLQVAELAASGTIGDLRLVRAAFTFAVREPGTNIRFRSDLGGGSLYDVGCYCINASRMVLGEPVEVFAWGGIGSHGVDEAVVALLRFDTHRTAVVDCGLRIMRREEVEIVGTDGRFLIPKAFLPGTADAEFYDFRGAEQSRRVVPGVNQTQRMVEGFADAVRSGASVPYSPEDAVSNLTVIEAVLRSLRSGRPELIQREPAGTGS
ncbi:MAG TPA: Gfo/Idh/MocA family oxidoreductase [bacterium]|nr:Gfo/Idh/MocA family oxidoreductase [bacterium]